jgi:hypothetical protein
MARYIDAEHLMQKLSRMIDFCEKHKVSGLNALFQMGDAIMDCPTADVAPKSEVAAVKIELEAMRTAANAYKMHYEKAKSEVAIEIIQDIAKACAPHDHHLNSLDFEIGYITAMNQVIAQLEEIKKKYTESGGLYEN